MAESPRDDSIRTPSTDGPENLLAAIDRLADCDRPAYTFVDYRTSRAGDRYTYSWSELHTRATAVAARLRGLVRPGSRVAVLCPQSLDYVVGFLGCLYAGVVAVPLYNPRSDGSNDDRLTSAIADSDPEVWLASESTLEATRAFRERQTVPAPKHILAVDSVPAAAAVDFEPTPIALDDTAYLQYTSGSTRKPTGAIITHNALVNNARQIVIGYGADDSTTAVGWIPFFHDMGLMQLVVQTAYAGGHSVFMSPGAFTRRPARWLKLLSEFDNVMTAAPNFAYEYSISALSERDKATIDLSGVTTAINGAEPIRPETVEAFLEATGPLGMRASAHRPSYGLAEATVLVSTSPTGTAMRVESVDRERLAQGEFVPAADESTAQRLVSVGKPVDQHVAIVDPQTRTQVADGAVGELWVNGPNVAAGYWQDDERTADEFDAELLGATAGLPARGWLRTGDLAVRHDGELFITGRIKDLLIVDGKNHYPQDIEATVQTVHPAIRGGRVAVFTVEHRGSEGLVAVVETGQAEDGTSSSDIEARIRTAVSHQHDLPLAELKLVRPGAVARTSSGKVARSATRGRYLDGSLEEELLTW